MHVENSIKVVRLKRVKYETKQRKYDRYWYRGYEKGNEV
jgi:hypothetical protein